MHRHSCGKVFCSEPVANIKTTEFGGNVMTQPDYKGLVETTIRKIEIRIFILPLNVTEIILYG